MTQPPGYGPPQYPPPGYRPLPPPLSPGGQPLADFGTRLLAYLIDTTILTVVAFVLAVPVFLVVFLLVLPDTAAPGTTDTSFSGFLLPIIAVELGFVVLLMAAYYVYYVEMMHRTGQTVGKKVMKLRVVPIRPDATLTRGMAAKRYAVEFVAGMLVPFFSYLDGLWQLWDKPYLQTLHDKAAQTVVVKVAA